MDNYFRTESNELVNIIDHTLEQIDKYNEVKIYVSTDSQNFGEHTVYATAIVYRYGLRGAHYIYYKQKVPRIKNTFERLFKEAEFSIETAQALTANMPIAIEAIELDYNSKKITKSTPLVSSTKGWAESLGYKVKVKPDDLIAAKAADHLCRI
jgi:predicted RNase H-related nuclease YkuK (DUF458 family)